MITLLARSGLLALTLALPVGGAYASAPSGFAVSAPTVTALADGAWTHGQVCRVSALPAGGAPAVTVERIDATGRVTGAAAVRLSRTLSGRESGCAVFGVRTDWRLSSSDRVRVRVGS